jgi:hypothetical protein
MPYSVNYVIQDGAQLGSQGISVVSDTQQHPLGTICQAYDGTYGMGEFIYLKGVASTAQGSWVLYNADDFTTSLLAANDIGPVAVAMCATVASTYGWYQIQGKTVGKAAASYADNGLVYATSTAGTIDDAVVAGDRVKNAKGASALDTPATGFAEFEISRPWMDDATAAYAPAWQ